MAVQFSIGMREDCAAAIRQLVLHGLPTTMIFASALAFASMDLPWPTKIGPFSRMRSLRSWPGPRGLEPTHITMSASPKASSGSELASMPANSGKPQSVNSIATPLSASSAMGSSKPWMMTGWSGPSISPEAMRKRSE